MITGTYVSQPGHPYMLMVEVNGRRYFTVFTTAAERRWWARAVCHRVRQYEPESFGAVEPQLIPPRQPTRDERKVMAAGLAPERVTEEWMNHPTAMPRLLADMARRHPGRGEHRWLRQ